MKSIFYIGRKNPNPPAVVLDSIIPEQMKSWQSYKLKSAINAIGSASTKLIWEYGNVLHIISDKKCCLDINLAGLPAGQLLMTFKIKMALPTNNYSQYQFDLRFLNNIGPNYSWKEYNPALYSLRGEIPTGKEQNLIFPLRGIPDWLNGRYRRASNCFCHHAVTSV